MIFTSFLQMASLLIPQLGVPVPVQSPNLVRYTSVEYVDDRIGGLPPAPIVPAIQSGILNFNAPSGSVTFSTPFSSRPTITLQATTFPPWSGGVEGSGLFYIVSADVNGFVVGFSGTIAFFDPMPLMWLAVGS